jgi:hypothetical protein
MEKSVQFGLYHLQHVRKIFGAVVEVEVIDVDDEQFAFLVVGDPVFVAFVEALEVVDTDAAFVVAASALDVLDQRRDAGAEVNEQVGRLELRGHALEQREVIFKIAAFHEAHVGQVGRKNVRVFVDRPVLDHRALPPLDVEYLLVAARQEKHLQIERPAFHLQVKIGEVRVGFGVFVVDIPPKTPGKHLAQGGFAGPDIAGDGYVFDQVFFGCRLCAHVVKCGVSYATWCFFGLKKISARGWVLHRTLDVRR